MFIMPYCVKITFEIDKEENWLESLDTVNEFLLIKIYTYTTYNISKRLFCISEYKYIIFIF